MRVGIVGGGITGLSAAYYLSKKGHQVVLFEKDVQLGGLASGLKFGDVFVDKYYHHIFTGDDSILSLIEELGLSERLAFKKPQTANFYRGRIYPFGSASDLLRFQPLGFAGRLRFGLVSLYLKKISDGRKFSAAAARDWLEKSYGRNSYQIIWEPLLRSKFGKDVSGISMAWFWSRVHDRSFSLGYLKSGFQVLVNELEETIKSNGGEVRLNTSLASLADMANFDKIIVTTPLPVFLDLAKGLPDEYKTKLRTIKFRSTLSTILILRKSFMKPYWLNINDEDFPFVAVVEHTNFIPSSEYGGKTILYVGSYLGSRDQKLEMSKEDLFDLYFPYLKKINPEFNKGWVEQSFVFKNDFAQPVVTTDYAAKIPPLETPFKNVYLATMAQVYPQDRGMNQAVRLGKDVAENIEA